MKYILITISFLLIYSIGHGQKPPHGSYTYTILFEEQNRQSLGATCTVIINGNKIKVIHNGSGALSGHKGDIIDSGILIKHSKTGKWIIGHTARDKYAKEIGGCSEGPLVIDFKNKRLYMC